VFRVLMILIAILTTLSGVGYWYYQDTQKRIAVLQENNATLEVAVQLNEDTINQLQSEYERVTETLREVNEEFSEIRKQNKDLQDRLSKNDIGFLGLNKPDLVERIINRATGKAFRCIEIISGAELTEEEKNATSANSFNSECPWLWNSNTASE